MTRAEAEEFPVGARVQVTWANQNYTAHVVRYDVEHAGGWIVAVKRVDTGNVSRFTKRSSLILAPDRGTLAAALADLEAVLD